MQHKWLLTFEAKVPDELSELPPKDRMAIFRSIAELLRSDNPSSVVGVKKLVEKRFEGLWRQRQGDYRIFFEIVSGEVVDQKFIYKGRLNIVSVVHRSQAY
jgi:mRNA-degrading endonuclease RelE of RelBE toxin-antitoxin system